MALSIRVEWGELTNFLSGAIPGWLFFRFDFVTLEIAKNFNL